MKDGKVHKNWPVVLICDEVEHDDELHHEVPVVRKKKVKRGGKTMERVPGRSGGAMTKRLESIETECDSCGGSGLYVGFAEPEGTAVVCITCDGTGMRVIKYKPFTGRKGKRGIKTVFRTKGTFIAGPIGPGGAGVSYTDFQRGIMPK